MKASLRSRFRIFLVPGRLHHCPLLLQHHGFAWWGPLCKWNDRAHALESSLFCPQCPETPVRVLVYSKTCSLSLPDGACMMYQIFHPHRWALGLPCFRVQDILAQAFRHVRCVPRAMAGVQGPASGAAAGCPPVLGLVCLFLCLLFFLWQERNF